MPKKNAGLRKLTFQTLENREVLSATLPVGTDLVENGDFENLEGEFASDWSNQVEVHDFAARSERGLVAKILQGETATQTVDVNVGQKYILTFDYRLAGATTEGQASLVNSGENFSAIDRWQTAATVFEADANSVDIQLMATGGDIFVDCVRLTPVEEASIINGGFEEMPNEQDDMFSSQDFSGWNTVGRRTDKKLNPIKNDSSEGSSSLNVDGSDNFLDRIFQNLESIEGQNYFVLFDVKASEVGTGEENELRVRWNDGYIGAFDGDAEWQTFGFVTDASSDLSRLLFREVGDLGNTGDGNGPYVDNVRVFRVIPGSDSLGIIEPDVQVREFVEDEGPVRILSDDFVLTNSVDNFVTGAVVTILNMQDSVNEEILSVEENANGINASYDSATGRLRLTGKATLAEYEAVFKTLTYDNLSDDPDTTTRNIRVTVNYGKSVSRPLFVDVSVEGVNDRPTLRPIVEGSVTVLTSFSTQVEASDAESPNDLIYSIVSSGTAIGDDHPGATISETGLIEWIPQQSGVGEFTVTVEDPEGAIVRRTFSVNAVLDGEVPDNFAPFSGARQLSNVTPTLRNGVYENPPSLNLDPTKEYRAVFHTDNGEIEILLYDGATPITVNNFVNLVRDGFYDGLTFHRVTSLIGSLTDGFIAQGGDPLGTGGGGPGYNFADENLGNSLFLKPVIAMANKGVGTATNGAQFFLTYDNQVTHLNGNHTIFGEITNGLDVLNLVTKREPNSSTPAEIIRRVTIVETDKT